MDEFLLLPLNLFFPSLPPSLPFQDPNAVTDSDDQMKWQFHFAIPALALQYSGIAYLHFERDWKPFRLPTSHR